MYFKLPDILVESGNTAKMMLIVSSTIINVAQTGANVNKIERAHLNQTCLKCAIKVRAPLAVAQLTESPSYVTSAPTGNFSSVKKAIW